MCKILDISIKFSVSLARGRSAGNFLEDLEEVVVIGEAHLFRDLVDLQRGIRQQPLRLPHAHGVDVVGEGAAGLLLKIWPR